MSEVILLFDIGNTSIKVGLMQEGKVYTAYTLRTDAGQTADSFGLNILSLLQHAKCATESIRACICSSVVPSMTPLVHSACQRFVGADFYQVPQNIPVPLINHYKNPTEVGADRLVGAYAARRLLPNALSIIVVDFGTATTFDCIHKNGYLGGLIFPGVHTATSALSTHAARLPRVGLDIDATEPMPGKDTASSIQHGIVFGYAAMVEGLTARLAKQLQSPVTVLATGGFAVDISKITQCFHHVVPDLLLDGLGQLYYEHITSSGEKS